MEDNGRELVPDPVNTPPVKDGYQRSKELTIMLIGSVGKMRSFKISRRFILYTSIFFSIYIVITLVIFYLYFDLLSTYTDQSDRLHELKTQLSEKIKTLEQNKLYINGLEEFYYATRKGVEEKADTDVSPKKTPESKIPKVNLSMETKTKPTARVVVEEKRDTVTTQAPEWSSSEMDFPDQAEDPDAPMKVMEDAETVPVKVSKKDSPDVKIPPSETVSQDAAQEDPIKDYIDVIDIGFQRSDAELTLDFKLANLLAEDKPAEGYIHIIVMDKDKECPPEWNNAYNKLADGFPIEFKHGQQFLIQRFRPYQRQYKKNPDSELPSFIRILVYSQSGQKVLEKEFAVTDEPDNDSGY